MFALRTSLVCALLLLFAKEFSFAQVGLPLIRNYSPKEYQGTPQVWCVLQSRSGLLYFGLTDLGAIQYDGKRWTEIPTPNGTTIYSLAETSGGTIYAGGVNDFGVIEHGGLGDEYKSLRHLLKDTISDFGNVWAVNNVGQRIFFLTYRFIICFDEEKRTIKVFKAPENERFFGAFTSGDEYFVRLSGAGMMRITDEGLATAPNGLDFRTGKAFLYGVADYAPGRKIIATKNEGFFIYNLEEGQPLKRFHFRDSSTLANSVPYALTNIDSSFLLGTFSNGIFLFDRQGNVLQIYNESRHLQNNSVNAMTVDASRNIWIGTSGGISKTEVSTDLSFWDKTNGLQGTVYDVLRVNDITYVCTETGLYYIPANGQPRLMGSEVYGQNWALTKFKKGNRTTVIAGRQSSVIEIDGDKITTIRQSDSHAHIVHQSKYDGSRLITEDTPYLISYRNVKGKWVFEGRWEGVEGNFRSIQEDEHGTLWLGTYSKGIVKVVPNFENITSPVEVRYYGKENGLPSLTGCSAFSVQGKIVFGTDKGIYRYEAAIDRFETWADLGEEFANGSRSIFRMSESRTGDVLVCSRDNLNADIILIKGYKGASSRIFQPFKRIPLMSALYALHADDEGNLWIGGSEGLFKYSPKEDTKNYDQPFSCFVRGVKTQNDSLIAASSNEPKSSPELGYSLNSLIFEFAAPFFDQEERTLYSYRLHGFDSEWSAWGNISTKEYTNLPAGTYQFEVKAKNVYGNESKSASYFFDVAPPWYATSWAYAIYVAALAGIFYAGVKIYTIKLQKDKLRLQQKVDERTKELVASEEELRMNLEVLNATLENLSRTQEKLTQSEKMASLGQLTAGISHEINNPMNFISGGVQQLMEMANEVAALVDSVPENKRQQMKELSSDMTELTRVVLSGVERTTKIIKGLKVFSNPSEVIPDEPVLDVRDAVEGSVTIMMSKIREHGVELKYEMKETPLVRGNGAMISQVVTNIIDNAIDALASIPQPRTIELKTFAEGNQVIISVRDNGPGIPAEHQTMIMNPFFTTKEVGKGTGLGLSISFSIMKKHNGSLEFVSSPGQGTEFKIGIPI